jgi:hydroxypyruvate reductase
MDSSLNPRELLERLYYTAVRRAQPSETLKDFLPAPPKGRTLVLGAGKAAGAMAYAMEAAWPSDAPMSGLVVTRYRHTPPRPQGLSDRIEVIEASHPVPDQASYEAAFRMLALTDGLTEDDQVVCLMSGGGSALLTLPIEGMDLAEKQRINQALLECGADIREINCVRKHISRIKGGLLATACHPARVITLAISDVPGDDVSVIASGPTVGDASTCADALVVLEKYDISVPGAVREALEAGRLETPKLNDPRFSNNEVRLIATPQQALGAAAVEAKRLGLDVRILGDDIEGESRVVGVEHAAMARAFMKNSSANRTPLLLLSGGETTVTVNMSVKEGPRGRGGRAGEFCLGLVAGLREEANVWALAADTDGIDGVEGNAGAFVCPDTLARARDAKLSLSDFLERNDSYGYFSELSDLFVTGPTHTNVNDFRAILIL